MLSCNKNVPCRIYMYLSSFHRRSRYTRTTMKINIIYIVPIYIVSSLYMAYAITYNIPIAYLFHYFIIYYNVYIMLSILDIYIYYNCSMTINNTCNLNAVLLDNLTCEYFILILFISFIGRYIKFIIYVST